MQVLKATTNTEVKSPEPLAAGGALSPDAGASPYKADVDAIDAVLAGNRERFSELIERYQTAVYATALGFTKEPHRAEDLAQEVFVQAFSMLKQLREKERFLPWLLQIARNKAMRETKKSAGRREQAILEDQEPSPARHLENEQERTAGVLSLIEQLPEAYRDVLRMKYQQGLSCKEIAQHEGVAIGTITSRLTRAVSILRTALGGKGGRTKE